ESLSKFREAFSRRFDTVHGGNRGAPKFPPTLTLMNLMRFSSAVSDAASRGEILEMVSKTLDQMRRGGMYDQIGGGFHRYSVDDHWLIPHFEKMLYDNALLASCYTEAYQATGEQRYARVVRETLDYV